MDRLVLILLLLVTFATGFNYGSNKAINIIYIKKAQKICELNKSKLVNISSLGRFTCENGIKATIMID